jgi:putative tryptophan/tyrosine transport system substrate-binding protein
MEEATMTCRPIGLLVALALGLLGALLAEAQQTANIPRLCFLAAYPVAESPVIAGLRRYDAFLRGLRDLGYVEGQNITIAYLSSDGRVDRFPTLAGECLRLQADVIVAETTPAALAAKHATQTVPIVLLATGDPVGTGLVESLARPGGNVTGLSHMAPGLSAKHLELLKEVMPRLVRVVVLANLADPVATPQVQELEQAARSLGVQLLIRNVQTPEDLSAAFSTAATEGAEGLITTAAAILNTYRARVVDLAARHRWPAVYGSKIFVDAGGLMSYGINPFWNYLGAAKFVDKILKSAKPADLPVEQPTTFEYVINLKTAQALEITIPPHLLMLADEVIR